MACSVCVSAYPRTQVNNTQQGLMAAETAGRGMLSSASNGQTLGNLHRPRYVLIKETFAPSNLEGKILVWQVDILQLRIQVKSTSNDSSEKHFIAKAIMVLKSVQLYDAK